MTYVLFFIVEKGLKKKKLNEWYLVPLKLIPSPMQSYDSIQLRSVSAVEIKCCSMIHIRSDTCLCYSEFRGHAKFMGYMGRCKWGAGLGIFLHICI